MSGAVTVASICLKFVGVEKPDGVPTAIVVTPAEIGSKAVLNKLVPPEKVRVPTVITPMFVSELVTVTSTERPPRTTWFWAQASVDGFSRAGVIWIEVLAEKVVVVKLPGELMMNPDGASVTVPVPLENAGADAVRVTEPLEASPCT
jgi:hypothetical protein